MSGSPQGVGAQLGQVIEALRTTLGADSAAAMLLDGEGRLRAVGTTDPVAAQVERA